MSTYLCNFVKNGDPNGEGLVRWDKCKDAKTVMRFGNDHILQGKVDMAKLIKTTLTNKPVGE